MVEYNREQSPPEHNYRITRRDLEAILIVHFASLQLPTPIGHMLIALEHTAPRDIGTGDLIVTILESEQLAPPHHHHHGRPRP